jgi:hypothetical protein
MGNGGASGMSWASPELVNGQSNGCVYPAFLQAYLRGDVGNASAPATIEAHSIDIVTNGANTVIYAARGTVENLGSIDMEIHLANVTNIHPNDFILHS